MRGWIEHEDKYGFPFLSKQIAGAEVRVYADSFSVAPPERGGGVDFYLFNDGGLEFLLSGDDLEAAKAEIRQAADFLARRQDPEEAAA